MRSDRRWLVVAIALACLTGCSDPPSFQVETTIHADGSCDRTIRQPKSDFLPKAALEPQWKSLWKTVTDAEGPPDIIQPANAAQPGGQTYFIARGSFASPNQIPAHYQLTIPEVPEVGSSELERGYERVEYGFVIEHRWTEKITNIVTMPRFLLARDKVLNTLLPLSTDAIEKVFAADYDVSQLTAHLTSKGRHFLENTSLIFYDSAANHRMFDKNNQLDPTLLKALLDEAENFGLDRGDLEMVLSTSTAENTNQSRIYTVLAKFVSAYCRHPDGSEIKRAEAEELIKGIHNGTRYRAAVASQTQRFSTLLEHNKSIANRLSQSAIEMLGLYWQAAFLHYNGDFRFDFSVTLPGSLVETSGIGTENGYTRWKFRGADIFPDGYIMKARSLVINRAAQRKALGRVVIDTEAKALEFIDMVGTDKGLREAVRTLAETGQRECLNDRPDFTNLERDAAKKLRSLLFRP